MLRANIRLHKAVTEGTAEDVRKILDEPADLDYPVDINCAGGEYNLIYRALHRAESVIDDPVFPNERKDAEEIALLLIGRGCDVHDYGEIRGVNVSGRPLQHAAYYGYPEVADALLRKGAEANVVDDCGESAFAMGCRNNGSDGRKASTLITLAAKMKMAEVFIKHGADSSYAGIRDPKGELLLDDRGQARGILKSAICVAAQSTTNDPEYRPLFDLLLPHAKNLEPLKSMVDQLSKDDDSYSWAKPAIEQEEQRRAAEQQQNSLNRSSLSA